MISWVWLVAFYGILKGMRDIIKKKALKISSVTEVLFFYTLIGFLFVLPDTGSALQTDMSVLPWVAVKSFIIFAAWVAGFRAIKKMPVGLYGVMDMSRVVFATVLGVTVLGEELTTNRIIGLLLVLIGLFAVNFVKSGAGEKVKFRYILMSLVCCLGNAVSEMLDKRLMVRMESGALQFWYMLFLVGFYLLYMIVTRVRVDWRSLIRNYHILLLSILFVIGDRALFIANAQGGSTVVVMTLIKQCSVLVTILGGYFVFREKGVLAKILCALVIILGITICVA